MLAAALSVAGCVVHAVICIATIGRLGLMWLTVLLLAALQALPLLMLPELLHLHLPPLGPRWSALNVLTRAFPAAARLIQFSIVLAYVCGGQ
jgi:hypothetical protein